ncbi:MAG: hypothetical protein JXM79_00115 [Sedimentisphaerales bacterium]|nr:hypothetical protein [Sedimentisphaerales bacterium]
MFKKLVLLISVVLTLALSGGNTALGGSVEAQCSESLEEHLDTGALDTGSSDLEMPYEDAGDYQLVGLRFLNVDVPNHAIITSAWVQFTADNEKLTGEPVNLAIWGRLEPNPGTFTGTGAVSSAPKTSVYAKWSNIPAWASGDRGPDQQTSDISIVIDELVNQDGWAMGNALALLIGDDPDAPSNSNRSVVSTANTIILHVEYTSFFAHRPNPANGSMINDTWVSLSWLPGQTAASHDVYFSDNYSDVKDGTADVFQGNQTSTDLLAGFPGFPYPEGLIPGTTYYWRIDEIEADGTTKHTGSVWRFSIPPKTAYNPDPADGAGSVGPDDVTLTWTPGFKAKLHTIYLGTDFDVVDNASGGIPQGLKTYNPGPLESASVYYWRVDEFDPPNTYKGNVWSFTTPGAVGDPQPAYDATDIPMNVILSWTAADSAASHRLYFGTDKEMVRNANIGSSEDKGSKTLGDENYDPGLLEPETTYYWRVDEVDGQSNVSKGPVWIFTTGTSLLIDDFEGYTDDDTAGEAIWQTWIDGYGIADNGAQVGYLLPPYAEQTIVHGGLQSMPLLYINEAGVTNSEAVMSLTFPRDWTLAGVAELSIWFRGNSANAAEPLYAAISNSSGSPGIAAHDNPSAAQIGAWTNWTIPLQTFSDQGINLTDVDKIAIGLGSEAGVTAGGTGTIYVDDIRLSQP